MSESHTTLLVRVERDTHRVHVPCGTRGALDAHAIERAANAVLDLMYRYRWRAFTPLQAVAWCARHAPEARVRLLDAFGRVV